MTIDSINEPSMAMALYEPINPTGGRLTAWAEAARAAASLGSSLSKTSFVPKDFRGKPEECAAAILYGDEIGLTPMQAVQSVYVVSGKPGLYARAMLAIVLSAGHAVETVKKTDSTVTVRGRRKGSDTWIEETWTTERARRAGYTNNRKYETDPQAMLLARAQSDVCRQIAPDALAGLAYSVEELELAESAPTTRVVRNQPAQGTKVQRKVVESASAVEASPAVVEEPAFEDEPAVIIEDAVVAEGIDEAVLEQEPEPLITTDQSKKMHEMLKVSGYTDRAAALAYCAWVTGREVPSTKVLTYSEADHIIHSLSAAVDDEEAEQ